MVVSALFFSVMVAMVKVARQDLSAVEVICWRGVSAVPLAFLITAGRGLRIVNGRAFAVRTVFGFASMVCFFTASRGLTVADVSLIGKLQPLLVALIAPLVLGVSERAGAGLWGLMTVALLGCGILLAPELRVGSTAGLWALASTGFSACAHISLRRLGATDDARVVVAWFQLAVVPLSVAFYLAWSGTLPPVPPAELWPLLLGIGAVATAGQVLLTWAYALDTAPRVAAAAYVAPLWALMVDAVAFGVLPDGSTWVGGTLVVLAGVGLVFARSPRAPAAPAA